MSKNIPIAFCFDENMWRLAGVAIASLLYNGRGVCTYDIYCVVPDTFAASRRRELTRMVGDMDDKSTITFLNANHDFDASVSNELTIGTYFRFMLSKLLPNLDKIIYADCDVVFEDALADMYNMDMGENIIGAVRDADQGRPYPAAPNGYINAGIQLINLAAVRKNNLYDTWVALSKTGQFRYMDQDIVNKTCDGKILYLPLRYNYMPGAGGRLARATAAGVYSADELRTAQKNPAIVHYILRQPWRGLYNERGIAWWQYAHMTPFYAAFRAALETQPELDVRWMRLFNTVKFIKIKRRKDNVKYYLFGVIPLVRVSL